MWQKHKTKREKKLRRAKYHLLKAVGYSTKLSCRARDWRLTKIINVLYHKPIIIGDEK